MAKKIKSNVKLQIEAGKATPAPPVGTALGPQGINIGDFVNKFNQATAQMTGNVIPVEITIYEDRSFDFVLKSPVASNLILKAAELEKGSSDPAKKKVGKISRAQIREIAELKMQDLNAASLASAEKIIEGTARSMGVDIV